MTPAQKVDMRRESREIQQWNCSHDWQEFIDSRSGGFVRCRKCGKDVDCEEDESW